jgi:hypothetical protein
VSSLSHVFLRSASYAPLHDAAVGRAEEQLVQWTLSVAQDAQVCSSIARAAMRHDEFRWKSLVGCLAGCGRLLTVEAAIFVLRRKHFLSEFRNPWNSISRIQRLRSGRQRGFPNGPGPAPTVASLHRSFMRCHTMSGNGRAYLRIICGTQGPSRRARCLAEDPRLQMYLGVEATRRYVDTANARRTQRHNVPVKVIAFAHSGVLAGGRAPLDA